MNEQITKEMDTQQNLAQSRMSQKKQFMGLGSQGDVMGQRSQRVFVD